MSRRERAVELVRLVAGVAREQQLTLLAASLAYYLFAALVPLGLFVIIGLSLIGGNVFSQVIDAASGTLLPEGTSVSSDQVLQSGGRLRAAILGGVLLTWTAVRMFGALDSAFVTVYDDRERASIRGKIFDVVVVLLVVVLATAVLGVIGVGLAVVVGDGLFLRVVSPVFVFVALSVVFVPVFYRLPETDVSVREILPGTVFAAVVWTVSGVVVRLYATVAGSVEIYGVIGVLLLVLAWLYVCSLGLVTGAALNAVLAGRVDPDGEWVPAGYM